MDSPNPLLWDLLWFFVFGVAMIAAGLALRRRRPRPPTGSRGALTASLLLAASTLAGGYGAALPPDDLSTFLVVMRPDADAGDLLDGLAEVGGGILWAIAWGYERATGIEGLGFGDVKLLAMIGAFVGWQGIPLVILIASVTGSIAGMLVIFSRRGRAGLRRVHRTLGPRAVLPFLRRLGRSTEIPFGPLLALGALVVFYLPTPPRWLALLAP